MSELSPYMHVYTQAFEIEMKIPVEERSSKSTIDQRDKYCNNKYFRSKQKALMVSINSCDFPHSHGGRVRYEFVG